VASDKYQLETPEVFEEPDMIEAARDQLTAHKGNNAHGESAAVNKAMAMLTRMALRASDGIPTGAGE
jgi:hypothetical protein